MKKKIFSRLLSLVLTIIIAVSCMTVAILPVSAATYRNGAQSGPSTSYKNSRYYSNYLKVPITGDNRTDLLAIALSQLGYQEGASNGAFSGEVSGGQNYVEFSYNMGDLGLGYGGSDYPWCASFVSWCLYQSRCTDQATHKDLGRNHIGDYTYIWKEISCSQWVRQLKGAGYYKYSAYEGGSYTPKYGDLVFFQNSKGVAHIGVCLYTSGGRIYTVEGNTSDSSGLEANGGGVYFKNYSLSTSYINGYGVLPYKSNSSVPKIDYSGNNPTPGLYVANAAKYIYSSESASSYSYVIPRFSVFEITKIGTNGTRLYGTFTTTTGATVSGWINNNSDRIIQLSSSEETVSAEDLAREALQKTINSAKAIRHYNYTEAKILEIRAAYKTAVSTLANTSATETQLKNADSALASLIKETGSNTIAHNNRGVYISGRNSYIRSGDCYMYSPSWNNGLITIDNANIRYTVNVVVKWSSYLGCNVVKSVSFGTGSSTPSIQLAEDEWLIAAHDWERGVAESDNPVEYSSTNYEILSNLQVGSRVYVSGCTALNAGTDIEPAAFIKFGPPDSTKMTGKNVRMENGDFVLYTPEFNSGLITHQNAGIHRSLNVLAQWDNDNAAWIVTDKFHGNGKEDESSNIEIVDGQVVISGIAWESGVEDGTEVVGSTANFGKLNTAEIGQQVVFSGITPTYGANALSVSANIDFIDYQGPEDDDVADEETPTNLALGKTYDALEVEGSTHVANLTDGIYPAELYPAGNWFGFNKARNTDENQVGYITVDLESRYALTSMRAHIFPGDFDSSIGIPAFVNVYTSTNGVDFDYVGDLSIDTSSSTAFWAELKVSDVNARYVRFAVGGGGDCYWVFLNEVEVYGTTLAGGENIALGCTQTVSTADEMYLTDLTDGIADDTLGDNKWLGFLADSENKNSNTTDGIGSAVIDLGARFKISEVTAHFFAGENAIGAGAPTSATVYVSIDGITYAKAGTMTLPDNPSAPYWATLSNCDAVGRYVRIDVGCNSQWTLLNEVEVYGTAHIQTTDNNIALEKPCTAPGYASSPYTASLTDGVASGIFQYGLNNSSWFGFLNTGDAATGNTTNNRGIVTIDLGGQAEITSTSLHLFAGDNDAGAVLPGYINVYISDDGEFFDYVDYVEFKETKTEAFWSEIPFDEPVYARYIKYAIGMNANSLVLLNEIKVSGTMLTTNEADEPGSLSAVTLAGDFNNWNATPNMQRVDDATVSVAMKFEEGTYEFKILEGSVWYGNSGTIENTTATTSDIGWEMTTDASNCILAASGGVYTFVYNTETKMLKVLHTPDTYYIRGDFNDWGTTDVLSENEDGTFSKTITLPAGTYEFKAANEDYSKQWPEFNHSITLDRKTDVTFILDIFDNTLTTKCVVKDFIVKFVDMDGTVLSTQEIREGSTAVAPDSPTRDGYRFTGWSGDFSAITRDTVIRATYVKTIGTLKVSVIGGCGFSISINDSAPRPQGSFYQNSRIPVGARVSITANKLVNDNFIGWINPANGQVLTTNSTYTFYATGNENFQAMFFTAIEDCSIVSFYHDKANQLSDMQYYSPGESILFPETIPQCLGYQFKGWNMTEAQIQAEIAKGNDVTVLPVWEKVLTYVDVTINGGTADGTQNDKGQFLMGEAVTVTANPAESGMKFAYWTDASGNVKSYNETYTFFLAGPTTLTAVFVSESEKIDYQVLTSVDNFTPGDYGTFTVTWFVPDKYEFVGGGIIAVNKDNYNESTFVHGSTDTNVWDRTGSDTLSANTFNWTGPVYSGQTWYAKCWAQYKDESGTVQTVYSDMFTAVKE